MAQSDEAARIIQSMEGKAPPTVAQAVYGATEDLAADRISEEDMQAIAAAAGSKLDEQHTAVVEGLLRKRLDEDVAEEAVQALRAGKA